MSATDPNSPPFNLVYMDSIAQRVARGGYGYVGKVGVSPIFYVLSSPGNGLTTGFGAGTTGEIARGVFGHGPFAPLVDINTQQNNGTAQLPSYAPSDGLSIHPGLADNSTVEYVPGGNRLLNPFAHTVGTSPNSFFRVTLKLTVSNGYDQLVVGWRKQQTYLTTTSGGFISGVDPVYTDFAAIGFAGTVATPNPVRVITDLNDTGTPVISTVGFTWASTVTHQLEVRVVGRKALYFINGAQVGNRITKDALGNTITAQSTNSVPSFSFDTTDVLVPFIFIRCDAAFAGAFIALQELEVGRLADIGLDNSARGGVVD